MLPSVILSEAKDLRPWPTAEIPRCARNDKELGGISTFFLNITLAPSGSRRREMKRGFTMVEVAVSLAILAIVLSATYPVVIKAARIAQQARDHYIAITMANSRVERSLNLPYGNLYLLAETNLQMTAQAVPDPNGDYRRTTSVNTNYALNLTQVTVTVEVRNRTTGKFDGSIESVSTLMTQYLTPPQ